MVVLIVVVQIVEVDQDAELAIEEGVAHQRAKSRPDFAIELLVVRLTRNWACGPGLSSGFWNLTLMVPPMVPEDRAMSGVLRRSTSPT